MDQVCDECVSNKNVNFMINPKKHKKKLKVTKWGNKAINENKKGDSSDSSSSSDDENTQKVHQHPKKNHEAVANFKNKIGELSKKSMPFYRPIDMLDYRRTLFEAMIFPELSKGIKFPARKYIYLLFLSFPNSNLYFPAEKFFHCQHQCFG